MLAGGDVKGPAAPLPSGLILEAGLSSRAKAAIAGAILVLASGSTGLSQVQLAQYATAPQPAEVDTALVVSVDVSNSVDEHRYTLQMEGIAKALEDPKVLDAILTGPRGGILFMMVTWSDRPQIAVPWIKIKSKADAAAAAAKVRKVPRQGGEFTCLAKMLRFVSDKIVTQVPVKAARLVVDVSGDGSDNCNPEEPARVVRDELVEANTVINGLPILEGREAATLAPWFVENVMGGPGSFVLPAEGYGDFGRAIKQKFVTEISWLSYQPSRYALQPGPRTKSQP